MKIFATVRGARGGSRLNIRGALTTLSPKTPPLEPLLIDRWLELIQLRYAACKLLLLSSTSFSYWSNSEFLLNSDHLLEP